MTYAEFSCPVGRFGAKVISRPHERVIIEAIGRAIAMNTSNELEVTLSADLYRRLRQESRRLSVPLRYLVASVVLDTIEDVEPRTTRDDCSEPALAV